MPEDTGFYIDDVCIPHTWYPISERNNVIVFKYNSTPVLYAYVPPGSYSTSNLGLAIATAMNAALSLVNITANPFESSYASVTNKLTFSFVAAANTSIFQILTDVEFKAASPTLVVRSMNPTLNNFALKPFDSSNDVTGYIDIYPIRNIYMTASGLGNFNTMSVAGDRNIVKQNPVNAGHGEVIFDQTVTGMDYLDCSRQTLSRLSFALRDVFGTVIDLNEIRVSFSIVFSRVQDGSYFFLEPII